MASNIILYVRQHMQFVFVNDSTQIVCCPSIKKVIDKNFYVILAKGSFSIRNG